MKTHYPSQTGDRQFFWHQHVKTGVWILGQQSRRKNGKFGSGWYERMFVRFKPDTSEEIMLRQFAQHETDLLFKDAAGVKSGTANWGSLEEAVTNFLQKGKERQ